MQHSATSLLILAETRHQELLADAVRIRRISTGHPRRRAGLLPTARCRAAVGGLLIRAGQALQAVPATRKGTASAGQ